MIVMSDASDLIGKTLSEFRVIKMTEVYRTNDSGDILKSEGCFSCKTLAKAYANNLPDPYLTHLRSVIIITNGEVGYFMGEGALLIGAEFAQSIIRKNVMSKLTPEEIQVLGLEYTSFGDSNDARR
jgi:hypothetical protein